MQKKKGVITPPLLIDAFKVLVTGWLQRAEPLPCRHLPK